MRRAIVLVLAIMLLLSSVSPLCILVAYPEVQVGVKSGDWMRYDIVTEERNWTGWQRFDLYEVEANLIKFNASTYSDSFGYINTTGQYNMSEMETNMAYPNDVLKTIVIPANMRTGDILLYYDMGSIPIAGETSATYLGATRSVIYATYTATNESSSEASRIDYKWDVITGVILEYTALYPDGKTTTGKIADTDLWSSQQGIDIYVLVTIVIVVAAIVLAVVLFVLRKRKKTAEISSQNNRTGFSRNI
jgi:hypothetical protein